MFENMSRAGYAIIIGFLLLVIFFSQQPSSRSYGVGAYNWIASKVVSFGASKTSGAVVNGGGAILKGAENIFKK